MQFIETRLECEEFKLPIITFGQEKVELKEGDEIGDSMMAIESMPKVQPRFEPILLSELTIDPKINESEKKKNCLNY